MLKTSSKSGIGKHRAAVRLELKRAAQLLIPKPKTEPTRQERRAAERERQKNRRHLHKLAAARRKDKGGAAAAGTRKKETDT